MDPKLAADLGNLSESERQVIFSVLKRDEDLRKRDELRIMRLKSELQWLRRRGAIRGGLDPMTSCARCRSQLGRIINRGAPCTICRAKVCKSCRVYARDGVQWFCIVCHKQLEIEAATGEWMNEFVRRSSHRRDRKAFVPPAEIVRSTISRGIRDKVENGGNRKVETDGGKAVDVSHSPSVRNRAAPLSMEVRLDQGTQLTAEADPKRLSTSTITADPPSPGLVPRSPRDCSPSPSPRPSPVPSPRQKSPLLKQRAVVVDQEQTDSSCGSTVSSPPLSTVPKRRAPRPPSHPSNRSDSGIEHELVQPSPKTSHSESLHSRQSSSSCSSGCADSRGGGGGSSFRTESQTTTDGMSDLSDSEVEPATGVVFRKVSLKRRKHINGRGRHASDEQCDVHIVEDPALCSPTARVPRSSPIPCSSAPVNPPESPSDLDVCWPDPHLPVATNKDTDGSLVECPAVDETADKIPWSPLEAESRVKGLGVGLSRSLEVLSHAVEKQFVDARPLSCSWTGEEASLVHCHEPSWDDLRLSSPDYEEDFLTSCCGNNGTSDSSSDILSNVTDKIVPEGDEYRIVFISSASSKSSGLNSGGDDDSASSSRRVSVLLMDEWDSSGAADSPPPLPLAPPPALPAGAFVSEGDGASPTYSLEEIEYIDRLPDSEMNGPWNDAAQARDATESDAHFGSCEEEQPFVSRLDVSSCSPATFLAARADSSEEQRTPSSPGDLPFVENGSDALQACENKAERSDLGGDSVTSLYAQETAHAAAAADVGESATELQLASTSRDASSAVSKATEFGEVGNDGDADRTRVEESPVEAVNICADIASSLADPISSDAEGQPLDEAYTLERHLVKTCGGEQTLVPECAAVEDGSLPPDATGGEDGRMTMGGNYAPLEDDAAHDGSEVEKSDAESQDTIIEDECYHRVRQLAAREKLLEANKDWTGDEAEDGEGQSGGDVVVVDDKEEAAEVTSESVELEQPGTGRVSEDPQNRCDTDVAVVPATRPVADLHQLIAQSRALTAASRSVEAADEHDVASSSSILEKYFVTALEQTAPGFGRSGRSSVPWCSKPINGHRTDCKEETVPPADWEDVEFADTCSEGRSESEHYDSDCHDVSTNGEDSEATAYDDDTDDDDDSTVSSTSSDEGSVYLRMTPIADNESKFRHLLDMSLHTIVEESCEESESERQADGDRRQAASSRISDPSELERYYHYTFGGACLDPRAAALLQTHAAQPSSVTSSSAAAADDHSVLLPRPLSLARSEDSEFSDDTLSETGSSCFSENTDVGEAMDDDELARLASSRLEKYFLTGFLGMDAAFGGLHHHREAAPSSGPHDGFSLDSNDGEQQVARVAGGDDDQSCAANGAAHATDDDVDIPFERNDDCDTIKRKKKQRKSVDSDEAGDVLGSIVDLFCGGGGGIREDSLHNEMQTPTAAGGDDDVLNTSGAVVENPGHCVVASRHQTSAGLVPVVDASMSECTEAPEITAADARTNNEQVPPPPAVVKIGSDMECRSEGKGFVKPPGSECQESSTSGSDVEASISTPGWDAIIHNDPYGTVPPYMSTSVGRKLDWKQQSRDSGFIGSSDDLLRESSERGEMDEDDMEEDGGGGPAAAVDDLHNRPNKLAAALEMLVETSSPPPFDSEILLGNSSTKEPAAAAASNNSQGTLPTVSSSSSLFGHFRGSTRSSRSNFGCASTTSDDEAQYIVNQLVSHIAKSMSRSPQLARAKPPEIEVFESELTKLMQSVPGIDATVKEIVEELSSTDYCSDSYESSDYAGSDQEMAPFAFEVHKAAPFPVGFGGHFRRTGSGRSWRSSTSTASKCSSLSFYDDGQLSEETMVTYQRFMDSLTKMAEHASDDAASVGGDSTSTSRSGNRSPPTFAKVVNHIRDRLTSLMREVQAESRSPKLTGSDADHGRTIVWRKPSSGCGSAAGDELSISSTTSSMNFDSEDSPTDTEVSIDSDDPASAAMMRAVGSSATALHSLTLARAQMEMMGGAAKGDTVGGAAATAASSRSRNLSAATSSGAGRATPDEDGGSSTGGLERWNSDMTIVDDDVRFTSVHKSEPMLSLPDNGQPQENKRHSLSFDMRLSVHIGESGFPSNTLQQRYRSAGRQVGSAGSLCWSRGSKRKCQSEWEMWRASDSADDMNSSSLTISSATVSSCRAPHKHSSCDPLPSTRTKLESLSPPPLVTAAAAASSVVQPAVGASSSYNTSGSASTTRDRRKHGLGHLVWRQKSGSSMSLREAPATSDLQSTKQQVQFRSSLHLQLGKKADDHQQQQQQSRCHWLFGGGHKHRDSGGSGPKTSIWTSSVKSCLSSPENLSDVGVDVTTAAGVDLSDGESTEGSSRLLPSQRSSTHSYLSQMHPLGHATMPSSGTFSSCSSQNLTSNSSPWAKASTLPRAGSDLSFVPNVSFLHKSHRCLTSNTLPHSYTLVPEQDSGGRTRTSTTTTSNCPPPKSATVVAPKSLESPKFRREVRSWPDESSPEVRPTSNHPSSSRSPNGRRTARPTVTSTPDPKYIPNISVVECSESKSQVTRSSAVTGGSEPDTFTEEDIDRLVAMHKNRSLSSLGVCSESMSSVYSAAGGGHYGNVTVRGEVEFRLSYNYVSGALEVHVKQCRDLAPVDIKRNRSDPYVKVYLLPDKSKSGKRKTRVKKHTLNPSFNEVLKFNVTISELETRTLWLTVWHSDMFGRNEFLGEVTLPMGYEAFDDTSSKWYFLQERLGPPEEVFSYKGDLVLALRFVPPDVTNQKRGQRNKGSLHVLVKEARNLMAVAANGTSDPFCKCYLLPDKGKGNKQKTSVVKRSCHPKWNHTFVYEDVSLESLKERCLELTIWDYDRLTSNDFLGGVRLSQGTGKFQGKKVDWMDSRGEEVTLWSTMLERPNVWVDSTVLLRPTMDHRQTSL